MPERLADKTSASVQGSASPVLVVVVGQVCQHSPARRCASVEAALAFASCPSS